MTKPTIGDVVLIVAPSAETIAALARQAAIAREETIERTSESIESDPYYAQAFPSGADDNGA